MKKIKRFAKEIKRVRWPKPKEANNTFWSSITFIIICSLFLFGIAVGFTELWTQLGVGLSG